MLYRIPVYFTRFHLVIITYVISCPFMKYYRDIELQYLFQSKLILFHPPNSNNWMTAKWENQLTATEVTWDFKCELAHVNNWENTWYVSISQRELVWSKKLAQLSLFLFRWNIHKIVNAISKKLSVRPFTIKLASHFKSKTVTN